MKFTVLKCGGRNEDSVLFISKELTSMFRNDLKALSQQSSMSSPDSARDSCGRDSGQPLQVHIRALQTFYIMLSTTLPQRTRMTGEPWNSAGRITSLWLSHTGTNNNKAEGSEQKLESRCSRWCLVINGCWLCGRTDRFCTNATSRIYNTNKRRKNS